MARANLELVLLISAVQTETRQSCKRWGFTADDCLALASGFDVQTVRVETLAIEDDQSAMAAQLRAIRETPQSGLPRVVLMLSDAIAAGLNIARDGLAEIDKAALDCFREHVIALVAVGDVREQIHDVAAKLPLKASAEEAIKQLRDIVDGLKYLAPPVRVNLPSDCVTIRRLHTQTELLKAFKLRYQVYSKLNYVSRRVKLAHMPLEIDSFDSCAVHFGAFYRGSDKREQLVGTARIILAPTIDNNLFRDWTRSIARLDPDLFVEVSQPTNQMGLPVFMSQPMNDEFAENLDRQLRAAELSRVIVEDRFRGSGISSRLIEEAVGAAQRFLVSRIYLECLPLHVRLYEKFQFLRLGSGGAPVFQVNRTMVPMRREIPDPSDSWRAPAKPTAKDSRHAAK